MLNVLSLGGGLQSTAIAEMALDSKCRRIKKPDLIIHADTGSESVETMQTVDRIGKLCKKSHVDFKIVKSEKGSLYTYLFQKNGLNRIGDASCTDLFKIRPINRYVKKLVDTNTPKPWVRMWIGITTDERHRARENPLKWIQNYFPLLENNMSRDDVKFWMEKNRPGILVKKSGCFHCHFQSSNQWSQLKKNYPKYFDMALQLERNFKDNGGRIGLFKGQSIEGFDNNVTLQDFGFDIQPGDVSCSSSGVCFY